MRDNDLAQINHPVSHSFLPILDQSLQNNIVSKHVVSVCFCCIAFK